MNQQLGRLFLAGVCGLTLASAAGAQPFRQVYGPDGRPLAQSLPVTEIIPWGEDASRPSHRPIDSDVGDLSQAENLLARRLHHTHNLQDLQDLLKPFRDNPDLLRQFKGLKADDFKKLQETIQNNPDLLEDPKLASLLRQVDQLKRGDTLDDAKRQELQDLAKDFFEKHKQELSSLPHAGPLTGGPSDSLPWPTPLGPKAVTPPTPAPAASAPNWLNRDVLNGVAGLLKDIDRSPEGESLRNDLLHELAKKNGGSPGPAADLTGFLKSVLSSDQVSWLSHNFRPPSLPNSGNNGWSAAPSFPTAPALGGNSGDWLDGAVWVVALALLGVAAWLALSMARRQAVGAGAKGWSPGPWPVHPSRVSTRQDLIRAFEHLAYLCIGRGAGPLHHLDVAARLGRSGAGRAEAAGRLAHLYEQARYAPPDEDLSPAELTVARGDLAALAGAAA